MSKPIVEPKIRETSNIQLEDVRRFILDNATDTNVLGTTFYFSDEEIIDAAKRAVDAYNAIPPLNITMTYGNIKLNHIFLNGIAWQLCLSKLLQLQRRNVDYNSGGMRLNLVAKQVEALAYMKEDFKREFKESALTQKLNLNITRAFKSF